MAGRSNTSTDTRTQRARHFAGVAPVRPIHDNKRAAGAAATGGAADGSFVFDD